MSPGAGRPLRRIEYAGSVHDEREIDAVVEVLRGGPTALRIGRNVRAIRAARSPTLFGKRRGVMCNSGSSALYLAVEVLGLAAGRRDRHLGGHVLDRHRADGPGRARARVRRRRRPTPSRSTSTRIEAMIGPRTKAILAPNLIGNAPDWDRIRAIADRHGLQVVEDSLRRPRARRCAARRPAPAPTSAVTSFALSHIITAAGTGGMVCFDDDDLADRALLLRRWGRRSEVQLFGSQQGRRQAVLLRRSTATSSTTTCSSSTRSAGTSSRRSCRPPSAWCSSTSSPTTWPAGKRNFELTERALRPLAGRSSRCRELTDGRRDRLAHVPGALSTRVGASGAAEFQQWMEGHGVDTRMVWTGNAARQPAFTAIAPPRRAAAACPTPTG